eukprot:1875529-Prymnesium_polylepis.1
MTKATGDIDEIVANMTKLHKEIKEIAPYLKPVKDIAASEADENEGFRELENEMEYYERVLAPQGREAARRASIRSGTLRTS